MQLDEQLVQSMLLLFNLSLSLIKNKLQGYSDDCQAKREKPQYGKRKKDDVDEKERRKKRTRVMKMSSCLFLFLSLTFFPS